MIEVIRSELSQFEARLRGKIRDMQLVPITVAPEVSICPKCFKEMKVQKTYPRFLITKKYGNVRVRLIILECKYGCKNSEGSPVTCHSEIISRIVPKGANIGYDVEVHVGVQRYIHHRQREEIQEETSLEEIKLELITYIFEIRKAKIAYWLDPNKYPGEAIYQTGEPQRGKLLDSVLNN